MEGTPGTGKDMESLIGRLFANEQKQGANSYAQETPLQIDKENEKDALDRLAKHETLLYPTRVNNMRMQFAWAAVVLAFSWIFAIIFILLSHGVGRLHLYPFRCVAWGMGGTLTTAIVFYCVCMIIYACKLHLGAPRPERRKSALFWREAASPISFLSASIIGLIIFIAATLLIGNHDKYAFERLTDSVLITLITSTTVSVLGILGSVMWWLFPRKEKTN